MFLRAYIGESKVFDMLENIKQVAWEGSPDEVLQKYAPYFIHDATITKSSKRIVASLEEVFVECSNIVRIGVS